MIEAVVIEQRAEQLAHSEEKKVIPARRELSVLEILKQKNPGSNWSRAEWQENIKMYALFDEQGKTIGYTNETASFLIIGLIIDLNRGIVLNNQLEGLKVSK